AVAGVEFGVDVQQVGFDAGLADEQRGGGLAVGRARGDQAKYLQFARAQWATGGFSDLADQQSGHGGGQDGFAPVGGADGAQEFRRGCVLEQVTGGTRLDGGEYVGVAAVGGQDQYADTRGLLGELP